MLTHSSLTVGSGVLGVSGRAELGLAEGVWDSEGMKASQGSSASTLMGLILFFLLSSLILLLGRARSNSAEC